MSTEHGVEASFGMYGANIGGPARERSGVALEGQKQQGSIGSYHYPDNLARSIRHTGRILIEMIPKIYDTQRVARILGEDGEPSSAYLNPEQETAVMEGLIGGKKQQSYNLNVGKYDVTVTVGPSWTTKRQEGAAMMTEAMRSNPELTTVMGDLYFKSLDVPYADQIAKRMKAVLNPAVAQAEAQGEQADPKSQAMLAQIDQGMQMIQQKAAELQQAAQEVEQMKAAAEKEISGSDAMKKEVESSRRILAAESSRFAAEVKAAEAEFRVKDMEQTMIDDNENQEQTALQMIAASLENLSQELAALNKVMEQTMDITAQNGAALSRMSDSDSAYRQHVSSIADQILQNDKPH
jgi:hypothetical protein